MRLNKVMFHEHNVFWNYTASVKQISLGFIPAVARVASSHIIESPIFKKTELCSACPFFCVVHTMDATVFNCF